MNRNTCSKFIIILQNQIYFMNKSEERFIINDIISLQGKYFAATFNCNLKFTFCLYSQVKVTRNVTKFI